MIGSIILADVELSLGSLDELLRAAAREQPSANAMRSRVTPHVYGGAAKIPERFGGRQHRDRIRGIRDQLVACSPRHDSGNSPCHEWVNGRMRLARVVGDVPKHKHVGSNLLVAEIEAMEINQFANSGGLGVEVGELYCDAHKWTRREASRAKIPMSGTSKLDQLLLRTHRRRLAARSADQKQQKALDTKRAVLVVVEQRPQAAKPVDGAFEECRPRTLRHIDVVCRWAHGQYIGIMPIHGKML